MEYGREYPPGEEKLYKQLSPKEQKEWDCLSEDDKRAYIELSGDTGKEIIFKLESLNQILKSNNSRLENLSKTVKKFNKKYNLFGL